MLGTDLRNKHQAQMCGKVVGAKCLTLRLGADAETGCFAKMSVMLKTEAGFKYLAKALEADRRYKIWEQILDKV